MQAASWRACNHVNDAFASTAALYQRIWRFIQNFCQVLEACAAFSGVLSAELNNLCYSTRRASRLHAGIFKGLKYF